MKLFVTGAAGMLGQRVVGVARELGHDAVGSDIDDLDLTDAEAVRARLRAEAPVAVVNCAAYTDVDGAESHEELATLVNATAADNVARDCKELDAFVGQVSSDYVLVGAALRTYVTFAEHVPLHVS